MNPINRRTFLKAGSQSTAALLLGRTLIPHSPRAVSFVQALWSGAITSTSVQVNARIDHDSTTVRLLVSPNANLNNPVTSGFHTAAAATNNRMVGIPIGGLSSDTQYYYGIESGGVLDDTNQGQFKTPTAGPHSFSFAFSACADTGSIHTVFDKIRSLNPLFFLHTGDMHYANIDVNDRNAFRSAFDAVLGSSTQSALYRAVPVAYMWDDHDYGPNDSDSTSPGRQAARLTYQEYVPHYPLVAGSGDVPIYQAFTIGRVRFILTDLRSMRTPKSAADDANKTMMGNTQKSWFKNELLAARDREELIVWVSTVPWIGTATPGADYWAGYATERQELANFIRDNGIWCLLVLSGDAHMIALDDGSNSDYAAGGGAAFPTMVAAALDRPGKPRGGPYSHGEYAGGGQFGLVTITDDGGDTVSIDLSGRDASNNVIVQYSYDVSWKHTYLPIILSG